MKVMNLKEKEHQFKIKTKLKLTNRENKVKKLKKGNKKSPKLICTSQDFSLPNKNSLSEKKAKNIN